MQELRDMLHSGTSITLSASLPPHPLTASSQTSSFTSGRNDAVSMLDTLPERGRLPFGVVGKARVGFAVAVVGVATAPGGRNASANDVLLGGTPCSVSLATMRWRAETRLDPRGTRTRTICSPAATFRTTEPSDEPGRDEREALTDMAEDGEPGRPSDVLGRREEYDAEARGRCLCMVAGKEGCDTEGKSTLEGWVLMYSKPLELGNAGDVGAVGTTGEVGSGIGGIGTGAHGRWKLPGCRMLTRWRDCPVLAPPSAPPRVMVVPLLGEEA
jgi:hypothetical protein